MKLTKSIWILAGVTCAAGLAGCGKSEPAATPAPDAAAAAVVAPDNRPVASSEAVKAVQPMLTAAAAALKIPDFQTASVADLSSVALQALTSLGQTTGNASPTVKEKIDAVKTALAGNQAGEALSSLAGLTAAVKGIPGAEGLAGSVTQLVSAWSLKQGFDVAKISGVLGALQKQDYAALASQGASVLSKGGITGDQKALLNGVLNAYGIDATKAAGAAGALKGMFGK